jgi:[glutamine synthetase] adenylyltransferase / [glutamine synthetase]-adenylyl-L-tyrosine phosphorylase
MGSANRRAELESVPFQEDSRARASFDTILKNAGVHQAELHAALYKFLPKSADPDLALLQLERLLGTAHGQEQLPMLLANAARGLEAVLQLLAVSQFFADTLVTYPDAFDWIRKPVRNPTTDDLTAELKATLDHCVDDATTLRAFRRFRQLHLLRIGVNDLIRERPLEEVTRELARVADSSIKNALAVATRTITKKLGTPMTSGGKPARLSAFAFGKLGGDELNYSSDIDLMFVYDHDGDTNKRGGGVTNAECFGKIVAEVVRLLSSVTDRGFAYRVDLRLRPEGKSGPLARSLASTLSYYDHRGRTWERQALIKLRPVAGDRELRKEFMTAIEPFVYRKYFSFSEINEVKALKRRMEQFSTKAGTDGTDVKTGRGGIRDIEYAVQFLQLLNGGELPAVRQRNTLLALEALEIAGCFHSQETYLLSDAYRFLRRIEHRLQLLFDWQTHKLPAGLTELRKLARRMGYTPKNVAAYAENQSASGTISPQRRSPIDEQPASTFDTRQLLIDPLDLFLKDLHDKTNTNRQILDHLLHQTFGSDGSNTEPETDLILDPDPDEATIRTVLAAYPLRDPRTAYQNLCKLAQEAVPFLSHRRCRHFLASIAPQLLRAVSETPDPDGTLTNLERVTASLGAKAVLYELFSFSPATLKLYVDLCANSPYLGAILTNNPGMIDELLDSLVLDQPSNPEELRQELTDLLRGANDVEPIFHSFQDKEFLRLGVQDLLNKSDIRRTTSSLSDVAETILNAVFDLTEPKVMQKCGSALPPYVVLGLGKLGGREISYHSDLDILLVYANSDGQAAVQHAFTTLAQQAIRTTNKTGPLGRLYDVDMRLRPTGKSGALAISLDEFERYYLHGAQLWERQSLTRARVIRGSGAFARTMQVKVQEAMLSQPWTPAMLEELAGMRTRLEATTTTRSLKRGRGGLVDVEFAVQLLQLKYGREHPAILQPNLWEALTSLKDAKLAPVDILTTLSDGYTWLRFVEARLRIVTDRPLTEVPEHPDDLAKLARRCGYDSPAAFQQALTETKAGVRAAYVKLIERERSGPIVS